MNVIQSLFSSLDRVLTAFVKACLRALLMVAGLVFLLCLLVAGLVLSVGLVIWALVRGKPVSSLRFRWMTGMPGGFDRMNPLRKQRHTQDDVVDIDAREVGGNTGTLPHRTHEH
jgi:hypothetical protein